MKRLVFFYIRRFVFQQFKNIDKSDFYKLLII
jgi:hypothetical protein